ncbi:MAG: DPP IV N-terminal domain-containing protein, partial [Candidatus Cryptobacteroides sp.]
MLKIKILSIAIFIISLAWDLSAQVFNRLPDRWEWLDNKEVAFIYEGSDDSLSFAVNAFYRTKRPYARPEKVEAIVPEGAENVTLSPDSSKIAYTKANDLYVTDLTTGEEKRLTSDGSDVILNGYASWIYYEEIFGRPSKYKAFWWSPDSKKIAFYRFDNTKVPVFPIYSPFGNGGSLRKT